jgi:hypothetical protein
VLALSAEGQLAHTVARQRLRHLRHIAQLSQQGGAVGRVQVSSNVRSHLNHAAPLGRRRRPLLGQQLFPEGLQLAGQPHHALLLGALGAVRRLLLLLLRRRRLLLLQDLFQQLQLFLEHGIQLLYLQLLCRLLLVLVLVLLLVVGVLLLVL